MAKIVIRKATNEDIVRIFRLFKGAKSPRIRTGRVDADRAYQFTLVLIQSGYVAVADLNGNLVGTIGLSAFQAPGSKDMVLNSEWLYVQPKYREDGLAQSLISAALRFARKVNTELKLHICEEDYQQFGADISAMGMREAGRVFILGRQEDGEQRQPDPVPAHPGSAGPTVQPAADASSTPVTDADGPSPSGADEESGPVEPPAPIVEETYDPDHLLD